MAVKNFKFEANQVAWDAYFNLKLEEGSPQTSIHQYKTILLVLEREADKTFNEVSVDEIKAVMEAREGKNQNHLNGFLVTCINNKFIAARKDLILYLIPKDYSIMLSMLFQD